MMRISPFEPVAFACDSNTRSMATTATTDDDPVLEQWSVRDAARYSGLIYQNGKTNNVWTELPRGAKLSFDKRWINIVDHNYQECRYRLGEPYSEPPK